jgi:hypothetical protein
MPPVPEGKKPPPGGQQVRADLTHAPGALRQPLEVAE